MDLVRRNRIFGLALPIIGGMVSQNLLNIVDTAMVGFLGDAALAAVGLGGFIVFMCQALILGISTGVQSSAARRKGEGKPERAAAILNTASARLRAPLVALVCSHDRAAAHRRRIVPKRPPLKHGPEGRACCGRMRGEERRRAARSGANGNRCT